MDIKVQGNQTISGVLTPSGSKNSAVAMVPASILFDEPVIFENVPDITDVVRLTGILEKLGSKITWDKKARTLKIDNSSLRFENLDSEDLGTMRGTSLLWGPMLARFGKVNFRELPGGCTLGFRTLSAHYEAFRALGVSVRETQTSANMDIKKASPASVLLSEMSPTATENVVMLATGIPGKTAIKGAASEPQVQDLCRFLIKCGAKIHGVGSNILTVEGGRVLRPKRHRLLFDHYEAATFLALAAATGGQMRVMGVEKGIFEPIGQVFSRFGINVRYDKKSAFITNGTTPKIGDFEEYKAMSIKAQPWPALPVDTLPLFIPLALAAPRGQVVFHNWMYDAGLFWTSELLKLGANVIMADPHRVIVTAGNALYGAKIEAPYIIRAVVALAMTAMIARGESTILNADALYRGHPHFAENLRRMGAKIEEIKN